MGISVTRFTQPSKAGGRVGKEYHWTFNRKGKLILHAGVDVTCKRVHYNQNGNKAVYK